MPCASPDCISHLLSQGTCHFLLPRSSLHIVTAIRLSMSYRCWWSRSGAGKLRPMDQIQPAACFGKHSVVGTQPHSTICILSPAAFLLQQQSGVVATDTIWAKAQDAYCLTLYKMFANCWSRSLQSMHSDPESENWHDLRLGPLTPQLMANLFIWMKKMLSLHQWLQTKCWEMY